MKSILRIILLLALFGAAAPHTAGQGPPRWWPQFKRPKHVLLAIRPRSEDEYISLTTLAGLAARACNAGKIDEMVWIKQPNPSAYDMWLDAVLKQTGASQEGPLSAKEIANRLRQEGAVRGYIVYHPDESRRAIHSGEPDDTSCNVATTVCSVLTGFAVADTLEPEFAAVGFRRLGDARGVSEEQCFDRFKALLNRDVLAMQDPKVAEVRDAAVAMGAMVLSKADGLFEKCLEWETPNRPVLGWGIGDEFEIASRATRFGHFMTDTDWCLNLPLLSTETPGKDYPRKRLQNTHPRTIWDLTWEDNVHYASFIMSDGDNVQWTLGDFSKSEEKSWWNSPFRGKIPLGWSTCTDNLLQLSPYTADYLFNTATANDDFVCFGGAYFYPDLYGVSTRDRQTNLNQHTRDFTELNRFANVNTLIFNNRQWDSGAAVEAYRTFAAASPAVNGIFAFSFNQYVAGRGNTFWVPGGQNGETPVISMRFGLWNHNGDASMGDPVKVAALLNAMPHEGEVNSDRFFSTIIVHAWSWFAAPHDGQPAGEVDQNRGGSAGTGRGAAAAVWCSALLNPGVRLVTPTDFLLQMRLRLRTRSTIDAALSELERAADGKAAAHGAIKDARAALARGDFKAAFEDGKRAWELVSQFTK